MAVGPNGQPYLTTGSVGGGASAPLFGGIPLFMGMGLPGGLGGGGDVDINEIAARLFAGMNQTVEVPTSEKFIASLPDAAIGAAEVAAKAQCSVCLADFEEGEKDVCKVPVCGHLFHRAECLLPWLKSHNNCPVCRAQFQSAAEEQAEAQAAGGASSSAASSSSSSSASPAPAATGAQPRGSGGSSSGRGASSSGRVGGRAAAAAAAASSRNQTLQQIQQLQMMMGGGGLAAGLPFGSHGLFQQQHHYQHHHHHHQPGGGAVDEEGFDEADIAAAIRASEESMAAEGGGSSSSSGPSRQAEGGQPASGGADMDAADEGFCFALSESFRGMALPELWQAMEAEGLTVPVELVDSRSALVEHLTACAIAQASEGSSSSSSSSSGALPAAQAAMVLPAGSAEGLSIRLTCAPPLPPSSSSSSSSSSQTSVHKFAPGATLRTVVRTALPSLALRTGQRDRWARAAACGFQGCKLRLQVPQGRAWEAQAWDSSLAESGITNLSALMFHFE